MVQSSVLPNSGSSHPEVLNPDLILLDETLPGGASGLIHSEGRKIKLEQETEIMVDNDVNRSSPNHS